MSDRNRQYAAVGIFVLIFGGLLALATVFDLQVSFLLAEPGLVPGRYFSTSFPCNLVEVAAMAPIWGFATFAACTLVVYLHQRGGAAAGTGFFRPVRFCGQFLSAGYDEIPVPDSGEGAFVKAVVV